MKCWNVSSQSVNQAHAADSFTSSSRHNHREYVAATGLCGLHHLLWSDPHLYRRSGHTDAHRHEQPRPCHNMTIANEAWQRASRQSSQLALPVCFSGLHYPHHSTSPPLIPGTKQMIVFSPAFFFSLGSIWGDVIMHAPTPYFPLIEGK